MSWPCRHPLQRLSQRDLLSPVPPVWCSLLKERRVTHTYTHRSRLFSRCLSRRSMLKFSPSSVLTCSANTKEEKLKVLIQKSCMWFKRPRCHAAALETFCRTDPVKRQLAPLFALLCSYTYLQHNR
jgi:hypothetical protein